MPNNNQTHTLMQIQCNWEDFIHEKSANTFWITCNPNFSGNVYCDVKVLPNNKFTCEVDNFQVTKFDQQKKLISITHIPTNTTRTFVAPRAIYSQLHSKEAIDCIDLSPGGNIGITGGKDGKLRVWDANNGQLRRDLQGHVGDINVCRILPSGKVAMSGSADLQIKIWDLTSGECAVTLRGHRAGVTTIDFIDRGRNFVAGSRDGIVKLWDCATQSCITDLYSTTTEVSQVCASKNSSLGSSGAARDQKEFSTEEQIVAITTDAGNLAVIDVRSRKTVFSFTFESSLSCCQFVEHGNVVIAGSTDGRLLKADLRMNATPVATKVSGTTIKAMRQHDKDSVWCTTNDGSCILWNSATNDIQYDLSGSDYDPLNGVAVFNKTIFTCCRDGAVRRYEIL